MNVEIKKEILLENPLEKAFLLFVKHFHEWWPQEYTWSQDKLEKISLGTSVGELCSETGPMGFRCDWGRILEMTENKLIKFSWQISPKREPVPDPDRGSEVTVMFDSIHSETRVTLIHDHFENHGEGYESYQQAMDSEYGWEYILNKFKNYTDQ